jgi:hypothetical protein
MGEVGGVHYMEGHASDSICVPYNVTVIGLRFKLYTLSEYYLKIQLRPQRKHENTTHLH